MTTANTTDKASLLLDWIHGDTDKAKITQPLAQSGTVFACFEAILGACQSVQLMLSTADDKIVEAGEAFNFLFRRPQLPFSRLLTETIGCYTLDRLVYWVMLDSPAPGKPKTLIVANKYQLRPVIRAGVVVGYYLRLPAGKQLPVLFEEVYPIYGYDPYATFDTISAISPLQAASASIGASALSSIYAESIFANGARPGGIIEHPGRIDPQDIDRLRSDFESRHQGVVKAGRVALLTGGAKFTALGSTFQELQYTAFSKLKATEICSAFGVPPEVVNLSTETQYSNGPAQQRFIVNTVIPMLLGLAEHITLGILSRFSSIGIKSVPLDKSINFTGTKSMPLNKRTSYKDAKSKAIYKATSLFAWFNTDEHPTVRQMNMERTKATLEYTNFGVPYNEVVSAFDLPFSEQLWGNTSFMSAGKLPVDYLLTPPAQPQPTQPQPDKKQLANPAPAQPLVKFTAAQAAALHRNHFRLIAPLENSYTQTLRAFFVRQQREVAKNIKPFFDGKSKSVEDILRIVFDVVQENNKLTAINTTFFYKGLDSGSGGLYSYLDITGEGLPDIKQFATVRQALQQQSLKITGVNITTRKAIAAALEVAVSDGKNYADTVELLREQFKLRLNSAKTTARTQVASAASTGRQAAMEAAGVAKKAWLTAGDGDVRAAHITAAQQYSAGIAVNQPFIVAGESLMYPGDPSGSAGNIISCRCLSVPVI